MGEERRIKEEGDDKPGGRPLKHASRNMRPNHPPPRILAHPLFRSRPPAYTRDGSLLTQRLAQHDVGHTAEGVALKEEDLHQRKQWEMESINCNVLHGVLYP